MVASEHWKSALLPIIAMHCVESHLSCSAVGLVGQDDHKDVSAAIVRLKGFNQSEVAQIDEPKMNKDGCWRGLSGLSEGLGFVLSQEHHIALFFQPKLI